MCLVNTNIADMYLLYMPLYKLGTTNIENHILAFGRCLFSEKKFTCSRGWSLDGSVFLFVENNNNHLQCFVLLANRSASQV